MVLTIKSIILYRCLLFTVWRGSSVQNVEHRLVWCPYIPSSDDDYDQEDSTTVAVVYGEQVSCSHSLSHSSACLSIIKLVQLFTVISLENLKAVL